MHPGIPRPRHSELRSSLLQAFEMDAIRAGASLLAIKDLPEPEREAWGPVLEKRGYSHVGGLPVACLDIDFTSVESYLARLSSGTRRDMRRKLRSALQLRIEVVHDISPHLDRVMALYRSTRARAQMRFEDLTATYFQGVPARMGANAFHVLYWRGDDLLATNLLLQGGDTLIDKFFCMDPQGGRDLNLYFISWFTNIQLCLERGLALYQSGQAAYADKLRLGCRLLRTSMQFRHRNRVVHAMLRLAAPMLDAEPASLAA
jgi:predicted N-acyltransferase